MLGPAVAGAVRDVSEVPWFAAVDDRVVGAAPVRVGAADTAGGDACRPERAEAVMFGVVASLLAGAACAVLLSGMSCAPGPVGECGAAGFGADLHMDGASRYVA